MREDRRTSNFVLTAAVAAFLAAPAEAAVWIVPGMTNITGINDTHFTSDLDILNRGVAAALLTFEYIPFAGQGDAPASVTRSVASGETLVLPNVLKSLWDLSEKAGALRITSAQPLQIAARTYNDANPAGTYGLALTAIPEEQLTRAGQIAHLPWVSHNQDTSRGYRTNLAVVLVTPEATATAYLLDQLGNEVGRQSFEGGPRVIQISSGNLAPAGLEAGRFEVEVTAGKATAYTAVVDNVTGDGIAVQPVPSPESATDVLVNGAARSPGREGTYFQTSLRIVNLADAPQDVTVTPLSVPGITQPATVHISGSGTFEARDVLGELFSAPDGSTGALRIQAAGPLLVLGRTSNIHQDGSPGSFGTLQLAVPNPGGLLPSETPGLLIGLSQTAEKPGYRTNTGLLAGPEGTSVNFYLRDRTGALVASSPVPRTLGPYQWVQPSLGDLFPDTAIPAHSTLEVLPISGSVDVYASVIDNGTGDPVVNQAVTLAQCLCIPPSVTTFTASPDSLESAGSTSLHWYVPGAESVQIHGIGEFPGAIGETTVSVTETVPFTLTAFNSCGSASSSTRVFAGQPRTVSVSPASAPPGQIIAVKTENVSPAEAPVAVVFSFTGGFSYRMEPEAVSAEGAVTAIVPLLPNSSSPGGLLTGPASVSVEYPNTVSTPTAFTLEAPARVADPSSAFLAILEELVSSGKANLAAQQGVPDAEAGDAGARLATLLDTYAEDLRKMALDIAANGSASVRLDIPSTAQPEPPVETVTKDDLSVFVAYLSALKQSGQALWPMRRKDTQDAGCAPPPLVQTDAPLKVCILAERTDPAFLIERYVQVPSGDLPGGGLQIKGPAVPSVKLPNVLLAQRALCELWPVWLSNFELNPLDPDPIPVKNSSLANIRAILDPHITPKEQAADMLLDRAKSGFKSRFKNHPAQPAVNAGIDKLWKQFSSWLKEQLDDVTKKWNPRIPGWGQRRLVTGTCDVKPLKSLKRKVEIVHEGQPEYKFKGMKKGSETLEAAAIENNFLFFDSAKKVFQIPVMVGYDTYLRATLWGGLVETCHAAREVVITEGLVLTLSKKCAGQFDLDGKSYSSSESHTVKISQSGEKEWKLDVSSQISQAPGIPTAESGLGAVLVVRRAKGTLGFTFRKEIVSAAFSASGHDYFAPPPGFTNGAYINLVPSFLEATGRNFTIDTPRRSDQYQPLNASGDADLNLSAGVRNHCEVWATDPRPRVPCGVSAKTSFKFSVIEKRR
ncbi:MAG: hypothetical protein IT186_16990 [Acidobacteria bacterium]|nr:hypothetical protein [Acidobacteriota bacterium]